MKTVLSLLTALLLCVGMSMAQATQPQSTTGNDQATTTTQTTTQTQTPAATQDQNATSQNGAAADQNANAADQNGTKKGKLPQTASPLPLLGLLGMGSLGLGAAARRKRK